MSNWLTNPEMEYDFDKVIEWEGSLKNKDINSGYVPASGSGLTIGHGVDISRQTVGELIDAGLSDSAVALLSPYAAQGDGKYGPVHKTGTYSLISKGHPLYIYNKDGGRKIKLGDEDVSKLNDYYREKTVASAEASYNRIINSRNASKNAPDWESLSPRKKTIMIDIAYNAGPYFIEDSTQILKKHVATGNWDGVANELEHGQWAEKDKPRHKKRAAYLNEEDYE